MEVVILSLAVSILLFGATQVMDKKSRKTTSLWEHFHDEKFQQAGLTRPSTDDLSQLTQDWDSLSKTMFYSVSLRSQEIIYYQYLVTNDLSMEKGVDVSQMIDWLPENSKGGTTCLTGSAVVWLLKEKRLLLGHDAFAIQGGSMAQYPDLLSTSNDLLLELAGNSFNGPTFMVVFMATMCALGHRLP